jgi:hypothetical protein
MGHAGLRVDINDIDRVEVGLIARQIAVLLLVVTADARAVLRDLGLVFTDCVILLERDSPGVQTEVAVLARLDGAVLGQ